jgi:preprotein translocase subunit SecD
MRISSFLSLMCAALLCAGGSSVRASDTEAQAKAREALRQKLQGAQNPSVAVAAGTGQPASADSEAVAKARRALQAKMQQLDWEASAPKAAPSIIAKPAPAPVDSESITKAREAMRQKLSQLEEQPVAQRENAKANVVQAKAEAAKEEAARAKADAEAAKATAKANAEAAKAKDEATKAAAENQALKEAEKKQIKKAGDFPPMAAPASPLPASKEARLAELLRRYKADEITPAQYHAERAKILAGP